MTRKKKGLNFIYNNLGTKTNIFQNLVASNYEVFLEIFQQKFSEFLKKFVIFSFLKSFFRWVSTNWDPIHFYKKLFGILRKPFQKGWDFTYRNLISSRVNRISKLCKISWRIVNFRLKNLQNDVSFHIRYPRKCGFHFLRLEFLTSRFCFLTSERIAEFQSNWFKKVWFWCFDFKITKQYAIEALWFQLTKVSCKYILHAFLVT